MSRSEVLGAAFLVSVAVGAAAVTLAASRQPVGPGGAPLVAADPLPHIVAGGDRALSWRSGGMMPGNPDPSAVGRREPPGVLG